MIGLSGAGKSRVAPLVAARLGVPAVDLDAEVEREAGITIAALVTRDGEAAFRERETRVLRVALERAGGAPGPAAGKPACVIACGGGILLRAENRSMLAARAFVVWLGVEPSVAAERIGGEGRLERPLLAGGPAEERLAELLAERRDAYAGAADATVETRGRTEHEVAVLIAELWERRSGTWAPSAS